MSKSRIYICVALILAFSFTLILSRQTHGEGGKKIQVEVCVLNDDAKYIEGIRVHISPYGKADPPMQTTTGGKCLRFEIEATTSFDIAFWHDGRIIGVLRALAGFKDATISVNYKRLSTESQKNPYLRLAEIHAYTNALSNRPAETPSTVIELLNGSEFKTQVTKITSDKQDMDAKKLYKDIMSHVNKLQKEKK